MSEDYDVVVIGGGPGGYVCAIKAAQLGKKVVCIEKRGALGGTCLNVGCIPSKALLNSSSKFMEAKKSFKEHGIHFDNITFSLDEMMSRKTKVVSDLCTGVEGLFRKNGVTYIKGEASFADDFTSTRSISIKLNDGGSKTVSGQSIVIATGSESSSIPGIEIDESSIVSSTGALELKKTPKSMIVIGGGYIGLELGSAWNNLGTSVTVVEYADRLMQSMDSDVSTEMLKILSKQGMIFKLSHKVVSVKKTDSGAIVSIESVDGSSKEELNVDVVLVSVGRRPYTAGLNLDKIGVTLDKFGRVPVNAHFMTNIDCVYAIGDIIEGPMLAHKAEEEGVAVAEYISGEIPYINHDIIPGVVYTHPEAAAIGKTEDQLKTEGAKYKVGKFKFIANSRAKTVAETDGFVKVIMCSESQRILGAHIVGPNAGELIGEVAFAMHCNATAEDIGMICHAHPGFAEALKEAAMAAYSKPIHS